MRYHRSSVASRSQLIVGISPNVVDPYDLLPRMGRTAGVFCRKTVLVISDLLPYPGNTVNFRNVTWLCLPCSVPGSSENVYLCSVGGGGREVGPNL